MPYSITTKDGITIQNIPDNVPADSQVLKDRVAAIRGGQTQAPEPPGILGSLASSGAQGLTLGFADELAGLFSPEAKQKMRQYQSRVEETRPGLSLLGEVGGAVLPALAAAPFTAGGSLAAIPASAAKGLGRRALTGAAIGAGTGGLSAVGKSEAETIPELGQEFAQGAAMGGAFGGALPVAGRAVRGAVDALPFGMAGSARRAVPEIEQVKEAASAFYKQADDIGLQVGNQKIAAIGRKMARELDEAGFDPDIHTKTAAAVRSFGKLGSEDAASLGQLENKRRILGQAAQSMEKADKSMATRMINVLDDEIASITLDDVVAGDTALASEVLKNARALWSRSAKAELIQEAIDKAGRQASGLENGLRTQFRQLRNNKKAMSGFSQDERDLIEKVATGDVGTNIARLVGKLSFGGGGSSNFLGGSIGMGAGYAAGGGLGAAVAPAVGFVGKKAAEQSTKSAAQRAQQAALSGIDPRLLAQTYRAAQPQQPLQNIMLSPRPYEAMGVAGPMTQQQGLLNMILQSGAAGNIGGLLGAQ